ncbi:hypothetical protein [Clostridium luticellarii]|uniref:Uncharacterized protein n=1 Tax=Clostridium luticellarii TaxID=1691940 RepID=A0A2T0BL94_9CLOT|nr:hypothetical protein [Clostridium luticellarii]PRR84664.1 hypothetical protein CLLU_23480 [Clostridium luticellarii]
MLNNASDFEKIYLACGSTDFRKQAESLVAPSCVYDTYLKDEKMSGQWNWTYRYDNAFAGGIFSLGNNGTRVCRVRVQKMFKVQ